MQVWPKSGSHGRADPQYESQPDIIALTTNKPVADLQNLMLAAKSFLHWLGSYLELSHHTL
jgi:hypothetical protein